jgi:hypothetical protein
MMIGKSLPRASVNIFRLPILIENIMTTTKPKSPKKKITIKHSTTYDFNWVSKKVSLEHFLAWIKATIPPRAKDVTLELREDWEYDSCLTYLELAWDVIESNPDYEKQLKKYQKKLKAWKEQ